MFNTVMKQDATAKAIPRDHRRAVRPGLPKREGTRRDRCHRRGLIQVLNIFPSVSTGGLWAIREIFFHIF